MVDKWCDDYVRDHDGAKPTYTLAQIGSGVAPMTFSKPWAAWNIDYNAKRFAAPSAPATQVASIVIPSVIADAWSSAVTAIEATKLKELEADKIMVRRELNQVIAEKADQATEMSAILADGEAVQEEFEQERAIAAAALATALATNVESDAALVGIQNELVQTQKAMAVQDTELKGTKTVAEKLERSLDKALSDERVAHANTQRILGELAEVQIANTHMGDEIAAANAARAAAEATLVDKEIKLESLEEKLEATRQDLGQREADLSGAAATTAGLREQLAAAETRAEQSRERSEAAVTAAADARGLVAALERQLASLKQGGKG